MSAAYGYNPRLDAQRAFQRATDEDVARAMSGYRPTVTGNADIGIERNDQRPSSLVDGVTKPRGYGVNAVQPIFSGFRTYNAVNEAEANVRAEREVLRDVERSVLLQAVTAYMDVVRDQELVRLNENNVNVLSRELKAAQDRFAVGEVTRTDVAQAEARRADAVSRLDAARANLRTSRGGYPARHRASAEQAGVAGHAGAVSAEVAAGGHRHQQQRGPARRRRRCTASRPPNTRSSGSAASCCRRCSCEASYDDRFGTSQADRRVRDVDAGAGAPTVPIYEAGDVYARVRQAKQNHIGVMQQIEQVRTEQRRTSSPPGRSSRPRAPSSNPIAWRWNPNKVALQGVREEEKVGQRTLLDVLNAELEYLNSQVNLETTRRNLVVAAYSVISAMGRLDAAWIGAAAYVYDPEVHYKEVRRKWFGLSITYGDGRTETFEAAPRRSRAGTP